MDVSLSSELLCCEASGGVDMELKCKAFPDPVLLKDHRVLESLLETEEKYMPSATYFHCVQTDIDPKMRETVALWMLSVCNEERRQEEVFALAMNLFDRFLSLVPMNRQQLQLLGTVCLLLASKLKESPPFDAERLVCYADGAFVLEELRAWELVVLSRLKWDLSAITPHAFLDQILDRLQLQLSESHRQTVREHAAFFIKLCATDSRFTSNPPSMVAAAAVASAIQGILPRQHQHTPPLQQQPRPSDNSFHPADRGGELSPRGRSPQSPDRTGTERSHSSPSSSPTRGFSNTAIKRFMQDLYNRLHSITQIDTDCLKECHRQLEIWTQSNTQDPSSSTSVTPTDVQDVHF